MEQGPSSLDLILKSLSEKATIKLDVYKNTEDAFHHLKTTLKSLESELLAAVHDKRLSIKYTERSPFDLEFRISDDILIFTMHPDIFSFHESHYIWKNSYILENQSRAYCGMISVYNFISDSFRFKRTNDLGYLIARIFINSENHYFVEGKRQLGYLYNNFDTDTIDPAAIRSISESAILYSLNFDIFIPPFDQVKVITVAEVLEKNITSLMSTGKRLGFKFQSDSDQIL